VARERDEETRGLRTRVEELEEKLRQKVGEEN
jgi:hypothetical protein